MRACVTFIPLHGQGSGHRSLPLLHTGVDVGGLPTSILPVLDVLEEEEEEEGGKEWMNTIINLYFLYILVLQEVELKDNSAHVRRSMKFHYARDEPPGQRTQRPPEVRGGVQQEARDLQRSEEVFSRKSETSRGQRRCSAGSQRLKVAGRLVVMRG